MKSLIVEDDFVGRLLLQRYLAPFGPCHVAVNGQEAIVAYGQSIQDKEPYDLICLDIMMPGIDGHEVLKHIRTCEDAIESPKISVKIIMTTAMADKANVFKAFRSQCDAYLPKPIRKDKLLEQLVELGLLQAAE
jgi:two-component system chemotaxis response regulator CheY